MTQDIPELSTAQWEFLAVFEALDTATTVDLAGELAPLPPGPFLDLLRLAKDEGWLKETGPNTYCLASSLPAPVESKLKAVNNPLRMSALLAAIDRLDLRNRLHPASLSRLLRRTGKVYESAMLEKALAQQALESGDLVSALDRFEKIVSLLDGIEGPSEQGGALFFATVLSLSNLRLRLGIRVGEVPELLRRARIAADRVGDRRSRALIDLHLGRFSYVSDNLSDAISSLVSGLDEVDKLGDEDILAQSAEFVGLYFFLQGMYKDAARHFDRAMLAAESQKAGVDNLFLPYAFSFCVAYLGQFHRAIGVLDYNWRRYRKKSETGLASLFRSALGIILLMMGKRQSALHHLLGALEDSRRYHSPQYILMTRMGLAYYHFLEKEIEKAAQTMFHGMNDAARDGYVVHQYIFPFALEMVFEFQQQYDHIQYAGHSFDQEMNRVINGPNIHLRGVAYRLRAREAARRGDDPETIRSDLRSSERYLKRSGDPIELAKTRAQIARLELRLGETQKASFLARAAWERISVYNGIFFPKELTPLLSDMGHRKDGAGPQADVLRRFLDLMEEFIPSADLDELLGRVVATSARFHGAERGGLFWFEGDKKNRAPVLRAGYNLSEDQVSAKEFRANLGYVFKAFRTNQALVNKTEHDPDEPGIKTRAVLCLPFEVRGRVRGVLYHDNSYIEEGFEVLDRGMLIRFARQMSAYIERIWEYSRLVERKALLTQGPSTRIKGTDSPVIVAQSSVMRQLLNLVDQVADSAAPVLILGETGVGKELLALRLHQMSPRASGSFVAVDLSAIPEGLVESELFGHEKGAFTGADRQKPGRFELAHQGTLFIDEAGEIPLHLQTKLLRVFQEKSFLRIGGSRTLSSDFRLVAATSRDLEMEVAEGRFREDLYYRLNVVPMKVPPLRERGKDVILLAQHFLHHYTRKHHRSAIMLTPEEKAVLLAYHWPGNVRELQNVIERGVLLSQNGSLELSLPEGHTSSKHPFADTPTLEELQRRYIRFTLEKTGGRISGPNGAAKLLGMKRTTLYTRMKKLGLKNTYQRPSR